MNFLTSVLKVARHDFAKGLRCCNGPPLNPMMRSILSLDLVHTLISCASGYEDL